MKQTIPEKPKAPRNRVIHEGIGELCNKEIVLVDSRGWWQSLGCKKIKHHKGVCKHTLTILEKIQRLFSSIFARG